MPLVADAWEMPQESNRAARKPEFRPAKEPTTRGEFSVGVVTITFRDTALDTKMEDVAKALNTVKGAGQGADLGVENYDGFSDSQGQGINQEEYFKIYSNDITWPKIQMLPDEATVYEDPHFFGYYCEYDFWENPVGWQTREEGMKRVEEMNKRAHRFAIRPLRGARPQFFCYNYITNRSEALEPELTEILLSYYANRGVEPDRTGRIRPRQVRYKYQARFAFDFNPWDNYAPIVRWGDPMWPNSKMQIMNSSGGVLAHEIGHCLGAPDVYRIGRTNDGIDGIASLMSYGPTANAFSRFYHHGYIKPQNYPIIRNPGKYTLYPRHTAPRGDQAIGYLIPSNHEHYLYHLEYIFDESAAVGVGPSHEGMLISVVNLGRNNYLGSPDYFYTYRPNDPFFRGLGDTRQGLFGARHGRTAFGPDTEPPSRLPNLLDGGIRIRNIQEDQGALTFELGFIPQPIKGQAYTDSMLPQIRLDSITNVLPRSFAMKCTIKFRGEPLKTDYGFCWSTRPKPTVRDSTYNLSHREIYQGQANELDPDTTYYVRAYASNGVGKERYSDEEIVVKTPPMTRDHFAVEPLCIDQFSLNNYLFRRYSYESLDRSGEYLGYNITCVLAKLIAYYRPKRFPSVPIEGVRSTAVNFDKLNWNPGADHYEPRLDEIDGFFQSVYNQGHELKFHEPKPHGQFLHYLRRLIGATNMPTASLVTPQNLAEVSALIHQDLSFSRPVIVIFYFNNEEAFDPPQWALIHGRDAGGKFYIDFPQNSKMFLTGHEAQPMMPGMFPADFLVQPRYVTHVITSCYVAK